jgi:alcohol dehydrogenase (cytochrome c)
MNKTQERLRAATMTILGGALATAVAMPAMAVDVTQGRLANSDLEAQNWLMGFQNYSSHRYSGLAQINRSNVGDLKVAYTIPLTSSLVGRTKTNSQNYPLVDNGMMYVDDAGGVYYKIDITSGTEGVVIWTADAAVEKDIGARSRGIAMWANSILHNLEDGRVISIDRDSGEFNWDLQIARIEGVPGSSGINIDREGFTAAPIAVNGKLLVGNSKGDAGSNGWLAALDIETGEELWRTYMIPGPGEFGFDTWADDHNAWKTGGAGLWTTGSVDLAANVTIWGTAQPVPMFDPEFRPGDNLYTNSAIAMDLDDGSIRWFFQYTPNESWDYDEQGVHMLIDAPYLGTDRSMVTHYGRNGYYYQLDRTNGDFISATQFVDMVNWTAGIDPKTGKPVEYDPNLALQTYIPETRFLRGEGLNNQAACPDFVGGVRWQPPAYNPNKRIAYSAGQDGCFILEVQGSLSLGPDGGIDREAQGGLFGHLDANWSEIQHFDQHGLLAAIDVTTGKVISRHRQTHPNRTGILATAGGLVFTGNDDGAITAHDDETLQELWRFHTGIVIKAPPISFSVGGKQYLAIIAGGNGGPVADRLSVGNTMYVFSL